MTVMYGSWHVTEVNIYIELSDLSTVNLFINAY